MNRSPSLRGLLVALAVCFAAAAPACGRQGEGERCVTENGNEDCEAGLVCVDGSELGQSSDVCCPETGSTDRRCNKVVGTGGGDTGTDTTSTTTTNAGGGGTDTTSTTTTTDAAGGGGTGGGGTGGTAGAGGTGGM